MKRTYIGTGTISLFVLFFILAVFGFFQTYFSLIPNFHPGITTLTHVHGISLTLWMLILIVQPGLVYFKKLKYHKRVGVFSYFFVPVLVFLMVMIIFQSFRVGIQQFPQVDILAFMFVPISAAFLFALSYVLAVLNRHSRVEHRSYMVINALVLLMAAFGRFEYTWLGSETFQSAIAISYLIPTAILVALIVWDFVNGILNKPYLIFLVLFLATTAFFYYATYGTLWQKIAGTIFL